uniref:Uncharacterized protein n=1 Tax=Anopheles christyi TaxID=43041 RepID=A0A182K9I7_9DIPT
MRKNRIDRPEAKLSPVSIATFTPRSSYKAVNPTTFPLPSPSRRVGCQRTDDFSADGSADNDVNAHPTSSKHLGPPEPDSCSQRYDDDDERTHHVLGETFRNVFNPGNRSATVPSRASNVDVDYFKTNLTDDKTPDANANRARNFDEEPNKYDTRAPRDKSIDRSVGPRHFGAENSASAPEPHGTAVPDTVDALGRPARMISFTDGEFIFGPFDERSLEFGRFELLSDKLHGAQTPAPTGTMLTGTPGTDEPQLKIAEAMSSPADESPTPIELENSVAVDDKWKIGALLSRAGVGHSISMTMAVNCIMGFEVRSNGKPYILCDVSGQLTREIPHSPRVECQQSPDSSPHPNDYTRWARFENGNISPKPDPSPHSENDLTANDREQSFLSPPPPAPPTTDHQTKRRTRGEEIEDIFQQLNHSLKANTAKQPEESAAKATLGQLVENVPVIERILDDLLTFSKQLLEQKQLLQERQQSIDDDANDQDGGTRWVSSDEKREMAPPAEINDDNLINLLASGGADEEMQEMTSAAGGTALSGDQHDTAQLSKSYKETKKSTPNNDANSNQLGSFLADDEGPPQQEDPFTNVAIFNWNPLDVYQQHGLFMIDPRFALADMRAISPMPALITSSQPTITPLPTVPEELVDTSSTDDQHPIEHQSAKKSGQEKGSNSSTLTAPDHGKMDACHNYCPASGDPTVYAGSSLTIRTGDNVDKIVQMNQVLHCYDPGHVRYPLEPDNRQQREPTGAPTEEGTYH